MKTYTLVMLLTIICNTVSPLFTEKMGLRTTTLVEGGKVLTDDAKIAETRILVTLRTH